MDPINLAAATIWINPINTTQTGFNSVDPSYTASDSQGFEVTNEVNSYAFRQASSFGNAFFVITNLATATTFAEAATNVWATNAVPPVIVYQPVGLTNYVGNPVSLSAVANGQGLASLTYQWLQGGVPYPSGNGANILHIPSAQTTDDGSYTIVATTPYGLSVTSSAVTVFISNAAVPPTFTSQPVSQSVYNGQTVIFTTSVISPDINTVTYQWYSNNVAVAGATTSTFTLNNASTNISGSLFSVCLLYTSFLHWNPVGDFNRAGLATGAENKIDQCQQCRGDRGAGAGGKDFWPGGRGDRRAARGILSGNP